MAKILAPNDSQSSKPCIVSNKKNSALHKYFDRGRRNIGAVEAFENKPTMIDLSQLLLGRSFARGADSRIHHGTYKDQPVAAKIIHVQSHVEDKRGGSARLEKQYNQEVNLLSRLNHPNVIKFVGACRQTDVYCIVTEFLAEGSLRSYFNNLEHDRTRLSLDKTIVLAIEIARGMEYVHSQGVIHRDLKPENVLIDQGYRLKIADFGVSCEEDCREIPEDYVGTYRWMAPEMIKRKRPCTRKVDVYSFGLMLFEMVSGRIPFAQLTPVQVAFAVGNKNLRPEFPKDCPAPMKALIERCWSSEPKKRPEFSQILGVLGQFEASLAQDGTLSMVPNSICQNDRKKSLIHWIHKLGASRAISH